MITRVTGLALFAVCALTGVSAAAQSLEDSVRSALSEHPTVEGAKARIQATAERVKDSRSGFFPEISLSAAAGRTYADNSTSRGLSVTRGAGYSGLGEGNATARQMIFDGMETYNRLQAAKASEQSSVYGLGDVREQLAFRVVQACAGLIRARKDLALLAGQKTSVKNYMGRIESMVKEGAADEAELQQAREVLSILENYIIDYEGQVATLEAEYAELTGRPAGEDLSVDFIGVDKLPADVQKAIADARAAHPLLKAASFEAQSAQRSTRAEKATFYPDINGELSYMEQDKRDLIGGESTDAKALVRMNWNLETGGGQLARIREKTYEQKQAESRILELDRAVERDIRKAFVERDTAQKQLEIQKKRLELTTKLLSTYKQQFEGAKISLLQLMQADNQLAISKLEQINAESRLLLAEYAILSSMGGLQGALGLRDLDKIASAKAP